MKNFRFKKGDRVNFITNFGRCKEAATIVSCDINMVSFKNEYTAELEDGKWIICIPEDALELIND